MGAGNSGRRDGRADQGHQQRERRPLTLWVTLPPRVRCRRQCSRVFPRYDPVKGRGHVTGATAVNGEINGNCPRHGQYRHRRGRHYGPRTPAGARVRRRRRATCGLDNGRYGQDRRDRIIRPLRIRCLGMVLCLVRHTGEVGHLRGAERSGRHSRGRTAWGRGHYFCQ